jgi:2-C-methyl-D-erythritol 4-phosphate cytidylyltransferase
LVPVGAVDVEVIAVGRVLDEGRGSLPFALVHGEALVAAATWALSEAGVLPLDARTSAAGVLDTIQDEGLPLVLHDSLCAMTPPAFIERCVRRVVEAGVVVAGVRPVTDTVKSVHDGLLGRTVDRDALAQVVSPLVVPAAVVVAHADRLADPAADLAALVDELRADAVVELVEAPVEAMRVSRPEDVRVLEALTRLP